MATRLILHVVCLRLSLLTERHQAFRYLSERHMGKTYLPRELAERYGVTEDKIRALIRAGELRAVNVALHVGGRPRWRIPEEAVAEFEARRAAHPRITRTRRRKQVEMAGNWV